MANTQRTLTADVVDDLAPQWEQDARALSRRFDEWFVNFQTMKRDLLALRRSAEYFNNAVQAIAAITTDVDADRPDYSYAAAAFLEALEELYPALTDNDAVGDATLADKNLREEFGLLARHAELAAAEARRKQPA